MINIHRLVFSLVNQVELFVAARELVGHFVEFLFLGDQRPALFKVNQQELVQQADIFICVCR